MTDLEFEILRDTFKPEIPPKEGFTLGKIYGENLYIGETLEDEDRRLEAGGKKVPGKTAMPCGRYLLTLYMSPTHGLVPLFNNVPNFTYTEIHGANHAEQLKGCVSVGKVRTEDGVANCSTIVHRIVSMIEKANEEGRQAYCTIKRAGE
jgi:hypothetical protein